MLRFPYVAAEMLAAETDHVLACFFPEPNLFPEANPDLDDKDLDFRDKFNMDMSGKFNTLGGDKNEENLEDVEEDIDLEKDKEFTDIQDISPVEMNDIEVLVDQKLDEKVKETEEETEDKEG